MARTISDEDIRLNIIVNGNPAQKQLLDLEKATRAVKKETEAFKIERKKLEQQGEKGSKRWLELNNAIKKNTTILDNNKAAMKELQNQIGVTGLTMAQLKKRASLLKMQLMHTVPGGAKEKEYRAELKAIGTRLDQLSLKGAKTKMSLSNIANGFNKYAALGASVVATTTGVVIGFQKMIDYNGKLSDAQSDVQKTTGLTKKEVDELTKSFGVFNTRTSRMDLLKIAEEGGRIGIAKQEIGDFVSVMNKANVALGDSFKGGPEQVASQLGKLKLLFKETKNIGVEKAYESIGSAINELGANGVATEANIASFATRVGSLPDNLKPTIQDALGLGAAFEESGIQAEVSGRAYSIFLGEAAKNTDKFAKVMGISAAQVEELINTNPTQFFLQFSSKLAETSKKGTDTAKTLQDLGLSADGVKKIVGAAGNNVERFKEVLDLSNKSMVEATSLTDEYNIKNNNFAATLEKVKKKTLGWFSSDGLVAFLQSSVEWFAEFIGATEDADGETTKFRNKLVLLAKIFAIVTAAILTNVAWVKLAVLWTNRNTQANLLYNLGLKARIIAEEASIVVTQLFAAAQMLLKGNVKGATQAIRVMSATLKTTPWGLVIGLVTAAVVAYVAFSDAAKEAVTKQELLNDAMAKTSAETVTQKENLKLLLEIARDENASLERRQKAVDELNRIVPGYNNNLTIQKAQTEGATKALKQFIKAQEQEILTRILKADWEKKLEKQKKLENTTLAEEVGYFEYSLNYIKNFGNATGIAISNLKTATENRKKKVDILKQETDASRELYKAQLELNGDVTTPTNTPLPPPPKPPTDPNKDPEDSMTPEDKRIAESKQKLAEFIANWENDQFIQKTLRETEQLEAQEAKEVAALEMKYLKMAEEAGFENAYLAGLEEIKNQEIQDVTDKWDAIRLKNKQEQDKKYRKADAQQKKALLKADQDLENAKKRLLETGVSTLSGIFSKKTAIYKLLFSLEKAMAISDVLIDTKKANAQITSNLAIANMKAVAANPLAGGLPFTAINTAIAGKETVTNNINAGIQIAGIAASAIQGFEEGLYPVQRAQDGKMFNAVYGGNTSTGIVSKPTVFKSSKGNYLAGEKDPELIVDGAAFKRINPNVKNSFMREIARVKGFEGGFYQQQNQPIISVSDTDVVNNEEDPFNAEIITALNRASTIFEKLENDGLVAYLSNDFKTAKKLQESINDYNNFRKKGNR